jgi:hypothetical protein
MSVFITSICCLCGPTVASSGPDDCHDHCRGATSHHCASHDDHDSGCPDQNQSKDHKDHGCDHCQQTQFSEASHVTVLKPAVLAWQTVPTELSITSSLHDMFRLTDDHLAAFARSAISTPTLLRLHCALNS